MKKINLTLIIALLYVSFSFAQKVNLDREYLSVSHIYLPSAPILDESLRTYIVDANVKDEYEKDELLKKIKLHGFEKRSDAGTISVNIEISGIIIDAVELRKREKVNKDKEGNVTSTDKYYTPIITYKSSGYARILNETSGKTTSLVLGKKSTYKASEYNSYKKASEYFKLNKENLTDKFQNEFINSIPFTVNKKLNNKFGYKPYISKALFWFLGSKKNDDYESQQESIKNVKSLLGKLDPNVPISDELKAELQENIDYLMTMVTKYAKDDKKHKKMRYSSYLNVAQLYYHFDMPDKAIEYAEKLIANDYDKKDGKKIIKISNALKAEFTLNKMNTRHFPVDTVDSTEL